MFFELLSYNDCVISYIKIIYCFVKVSSIFGNNPNITEELMLPISLDIANMFSRRRGKSSDFGESLTNKSNSSSEAGEEATSDEDKAEELPLAEQLRGVRRGPPRRRIGGSYRPLLPPSRFRPGPAPGKPLPKMDHTNCEMFTANICIRAKDYPM